jgi:palmitoyl-protein thioesterase
MFTIHILTLISYLVFIVIQLTNGTLLNSSDSHYPTILIHGIGGDKYDLDDIENYLTSKNILVHNLEIGNGKMDSIFWNINKQCQVFSQTINALNISQSKINVLGVSQGGLIARCYVERYSYLVKPVHSLITYGTPHMGIYMNWIPLERLEYWKNPFQYQKYLDSNDFLSYLNNEREHVDYNSYRNNMINLDNLLVIWSSLDTVIVPLETASWQYYNITEANINKKLTIIPIHKSNTYLNDSIGLQTLETNNKLMIEQYDCLHEQFKHPSCFLKKFNNQEMTLMDKTISVL